MVRLRSGKSPTTPPPPSATKATPRKKTSSKGTGSQRKKVLEEEYVQSYFDEDYEDHGFSTSVVEGSLDEECQPMLVSNAVFSLYVLIPVFVICISIWVQNNGPTSLPTVPSNPLPSYDTNNTNSSNDHNTTYLNPEVNITQQKFEALEEALSEIKKELDNSRVAQAAQLEKSEKEFTDFKLKSKVKEDKNKEAQENMLTELQAESNAKEEALRKLRDRMEEFKSQLSDQQPPVTSDESKYLMEMKIQRKKNFNSPFFGGRVCDNEVQMKYGTKFLTRVRKLLLFHPLLLMSSFTYDSKMLSPHDYPMCSGYNYLQSFICIIKEKFGQYNSPENALLADNNNNKRYMFSGSSGKVSVKNLKPVIAKSLSIEYAQGAIVEGQASSAPKDFSVYGYYLDREDRELKKVNLGKFVYKVGNDQPCLQNFVLENQNHLLIGTTLVVHSNYGTDYTSLYSYRLHKD